jgi:hypothetical protein
MQSPLPSELEQSQSTQSSPFYACSPRKLSMPSQGFIKAYSESEIDSDPSEGMEDENTFTDKRTKYNWVTVGEEKLKKEYLSKSQIDFRHQHSIRGTSHGNVLKCALHENCDFKLRLLWHGGIFGCINFILLLILLCILCIAVAAPSTARGSPPKVEEADSYEVSTSGTHNFVFMTLHELDGKIGIHPTWRGRVDELLAMGLMPMKVFNSIAKEATPTTQPLLPTMDQIYNRKKTVFRSRSKLSNQHAVDCFMKQRMVSFLFLYAHLRCC